MKQIRKIMILSALCLTTQIRETDAQIVLTMEKALEYSVDHNPDLRNSKMSLERYEYNLIAQRASLKSRFALSLDPFSYSQERRFDNFNSQWYTNISQSSSGTFSISQPIIWSDATVSLNNRLSWQGNESDRGTSGTNSNRAFSNSLYLSISQPLFTYNRTKMNLRSLELNYENSMISFALQRLNVEKNITNQFYSLYIAQKNLDISDSELEDAEKNYTIIKDKVEADLATKDELYQAELNLANSRSSAENRRVGLEDSKDALKQILGLDLNEDIMVSTTIEVEPVIIDMEKAIQSAFATRLELRQRAISREQLDNDLIQTKDNDSFDGSVSLSLGIMGDNANFQNVYDNPTNNPRVSVSFSVPIFDWGARKSRIKAKQLEIDMHELSSEEELKSIEISIRRSCRSLDNLLRQIEIAKQSETNAQLTYDLNSERYRNGELTGMQMNQFQTQLSSRKIAYSQAQINYKIELLNLKILTLYDFEKDEPIVPLSNIQQ